MKRILVFLIITGLILIIIMALSRKTKLSRNSKLTIATTVAPLKNIVQNIAGSNFEIIGLIPEGTDSHTFEPTPGNARDLAMADIVFVNGLSLEEPTVKLAQTNKKPTAPLIFLGENAISPNEYIFDFSFPKAKGLPNPHLWMNPIYGVRYAEIIKDELLKRDPINHDVYTNRYVKFKERIDILDTAIKTAINTIPVKQRKLLTYHDSFAYFAPRYDMTVIGAIQPSDFKEPGSSELVMLINQLRQERVPAIFGSEVFPSKILDTIGYEASVKYIDTLRDDDLPGQLNAANHTYIGMLVEDVKTMTKALGGNPSVLDLVDPTNLD